MGRAARDLRCRRVAASPAGELEKFHSGPPFRSTQLTEIRSRSGAYAEGLANVRVLAPAASATVTVVLAGVDQLVPVTGTWMALPPLTLTENVRVPSTSYVMVSSWLPAAATVTLLTVS